jgi:hypothetical protein
MNPKLEIRRANNEPKCGNCGWWEGKAAAAGACGRHNMYVHGGPLGASSGVALITLDLAVCTDWRDGDPVQEILPPESNK